MNKPLPRFARQITAETQGVGAPDSARLDADPPTESRVPIGVPDTNTIALVTILCLLNTLLRSGQLRITLRLAGFLDTLGVEDAL